MQRIESRAVTRGLFLSTGVALAFAVFLAAPAPARAALPDPAASGDRPAAGGKCDWSGSTNAAWETVSNWGGACVGVLPGTLDDVRVPTSASRFPVLTSAQTFRGLEIESGAVMTIGAAGFATLSGDALISGTIRSLPASRLKLAPGFDGSAARFLGAVSIEGKFDLSGLTSATPTLMVGNDGRLTIGPTGSLVANAAPLSGNPWVVKGQIDNQGLMHVLANLSIESPSGIHTSTGHIAVEGESSLIFKGNGSQQVVLTGTVALTRSSGLNPSSAFLMEGGKLLMQGGLLTGTGALALRNGAELALASDNIFFGGDLQLDAVQVTGRALVNRNQLRLSNTSVAADVDNRGQTALVLSNTIGGKLLTAAGSTLRFAPGADGELVRLQVNGEISNSGALVLTSTSALPNWEWLISTPMLTNRPGGQINVALSQALAVFGGQLINQGTFNVDGATWLTTSNVVHTSTGVIDVQGGYLNAMNGDFVNLGDLNLSGVSPVGGMASPHQSGGFLWVGSRTVTDGPGGNISAGPALLSAKTGAPRPMSINRYWIDGELRNHGTLNVSAELTVTYPGAAHSNAGVIAINDGYLSMPESLSSSGVINFNGGVASTGALKPQIQGRNIWIQTTALTNTLSGTLNAQATASEGVRIEAQLLNQGTLNVNAALTLTKPGAVHTNTGTINMLATFAGHEPFTNLGTVNLGMTPLTNAKDRPTPNGIAWMPNARVTNGLGGTINALQRAVLGAQLVNQGTLNVNATMVLTQPGGTHTNTGTINLNNDLEIGGEFTNNGVMNFGSAALNAPSAPAQTFRVIGQSGLLANGPGGTINALQHAVVEAQLANQGTLNVTATMVLTQAGSTHTNTGTINLHNDLEIGGEFTNNGVMNFGASTLNGPAVPAQGVRLIAHAGLLANGPGGTINALQHAVVEAQLLNQGTLNVNATMVLTQSGSTHTNTGTINLNNGLEIGGAFSNNGVINFGATALNAPSAPAQTFRFIGHSGLLANVPGGTINALQHAVVEAQLANQGTLNVNATMVLTQPGSTHTNTGTINLNNDLEIGGEFSNAGVINFNAALTSTGALQPTPRGQVIWIQANALNNAPSGTLNVLAPVISATLTAAPRAANATIQAQLLNQGTLNISTSLEISASGFIHQNGGVINVLADASFGQPLTNAGTISITAAQLSVAGAYTQTAGLTTLNGTLSVPEAWLLGGALRGAGALNGNLTNAARVAPGNSAGALSVGKHYTQMPAGSLDIELGGTTPETSYDVLNVGGDAILSGTLNVTLVNAFTPVNGNTFTFLNASSRSGVFSTLTGVTLDAGKRLAPLYGDSSAALLMQGRVTFLPQLRN